MPTEFIHGPDWECSSGPILSRMVALADLWPVGLNSESDNAGDKDILEDGLHPVVALGAKINRPNNLVGTVIKYINSNMVVVNLADKYCVKNYVANITGYTPGEGGAVPNFAGSYPALTPVYVDDSVALSEGCTLSMSWLNDNADPNPLAGYIFYCQDEYVDYQEGGPNREAVFPKVCADDELVEEELCILIVNDNGQSLAEYLFNRSQA